MRPDTSRTIKRGDSRCFWKKRGLRSRSYPRATGVQFLLATKQEARCNGVNDAPALAQTDLGIAIGAGTGVAIETAEVVLMWSDPLDMLDTIRLSKAMVTKMKQNLFWAAIYNLIAIPVAAGVLYPLGIRLSPAVGALAMSASSITVATNAVLLKGVERHLREK